MKKYVLMLGMSVLSYCTIVGDTERITAGTERFRSMLTGGVWEILGQAGISTGEAWYTSMTVDGEGTPYIAYQDVANQYKATVKKYNGSSWETVGEAGFSAGNVSYIRIAVDGEGTPYVVYQGLYNRVTVKKYNGSSWETVGSKGFSEDFAGHTSIAIDGGGVPYVAYRDIGYANKAVVKRYNGLEWESVGTAGFSAGRADYTRIALDGQGVPYIAYQDWGNGRKATVMKYNGSEWETVGTAGFSAGSAPCISFDLDGEGVPYISYKDYGNGSRATVKRYNGSSWESVGEEGFSVGAVGHTSLVLGEGGVPYIAYYDAGVGEKAVMMQYNGTEWESVGEAGFSEGRAVYTSLAVDGEGVPYVVYQDGANGKKAAVMKYELPAPPPIEYTWQNVGTAGILTGKASKGLSVAVNNQGVPFISFLDNNGQVVVRKFDGNRWVTIGRFESFSSSEKSFKIAPDGTLYLLYSNINTDSKQTVILKKYNGVAWENIGDPIMLRGLSHIESLAVSEDSIPYIVYGDYYHTSDGEFHTESLVKKYNGVSWENIGDPMDITFVSLAVNSEGTPYISYQGYNAKTDVKRYNGSEWEYVGSPSFGGGLSDNIFLDNSGTPYVSYDDRENSEKATVMKYNGSSWVSVGTAGFSIGSVDNTSLAIDDEGILYIAYTDNTYTDDGYNGKVVVKKYNGSGWEYIGIPGFSAGNHALDLSFTIDNKGIPYVVYQDWIRIFGSLFRTKLTVMKYDAVE